MREAPPVTILGAGVAGLTCALALARLGQPVQVVEQAPQITEVGAGLQIAPNGARILDALGVDIPHIASQAVRLINGPSGRDLLTMPLGPGFRLTHRADLIDGLARAAMDAGVVLRLGARVTDIAPGRVTTDLGVMRADRVIGADGVRGASRAYVAPTHTGEYTGQVAWRTTVPLDQPWPREAQVHVGPSRHMVLYPLRGGQRLNIVAVEERAQWTAPGWSHLDDPVNLRAAFGGFAAPIRALLDRVEQVHLWGLMDHGATPEWSRDAVTLIGDAAHPTLPFLAQGANLALEDAWTLAHAPDPAVWETTRRPRVTRALAEARSNADNYHLTGPKRLAAHAALRLVNRVAPSMMLRRYDWLYGHDVTVK